MKSLEKPSGNTNRHFFSFIYFSFQFVLYILFELEISYLTNQNIPFLKLEYFGSEGEIFLFVEVNIILYFKSQIFSEYRIFFFCKQNIMLVRLEYLFGPSQILFCSYISYSKKYIFMWLIYLFVVGLNSILSGLAFFF